MDAIIKDSQEYWLNCLAEYELALQSVPQKVDERLEKSLEYYADFVKYFSDSDLLEQANEMKKDIEIRLGTSEIPS